MIALRDQTGREMALNGPPRRIVSLVPSQTELLVDLGLDEELVGVTKFCVHPADLRDRKKSIGGTKNIRVEDVLALKPDLVVANKEENPRRAVEAIAAEVPTYVSDVDDLESAMAMITDIGILTGRESAAQQIRHDFKESLRRLDETVVGLKPMKALYLVWKDPYMAAGTDTFISAALHVLKLKNALADLGDKGKRYPALATDEMRALDPDVILLSSEPYPFEERHGVELARELPGIKMMCVDGEPFSWYGSRWNKSVDYFQRIAIRIRSVM